MGVEPWQALVEMVEAGTRSRHRDLAADAFERLRATTDAAGTDWALGVEAQSRALLSNGNDARCGYLEAIEFLDRTRIRGALARAHLLYGEWLRRAGQRAEARHHLRSAHEMFRAMGMRAFARRASTELLTVGGTIRDAGRPASVQLTAQEEQIVRLVQSGLSNTWPPGCSSARVPSSGI
ncbi:hypothetical protein [Nocardioides sp. YIM 152315]|uniref:hypothetical protein n=1 Tax=Nocardioides sp. YIM 152315 TaxID=3031760 RepID=UPI0023DA5BE8|nr:hypothetical protein [Nocardioides sp. YIM 152315]MDF1603228.1 hypothetical protein [Nocardioides sp. YIM 152315]